MDGAEPPHSRKTCSTFMTCGFGVRGGIAEHHVGTGRCRALHRSTREDNGFDPRAQVGQVRTVCVDAASDLGGVARQVPVTGDQQVDLHRGEHAECALECIEPVADEGDLEVAQEVPGPQEGGLRRRRSRGGRERARAYETAGHGNRRP